MAGLDFREDVGGQSGAYLTSAAWLQSGWFRFGPYEPGSSKAANVRSY